MRHRNNEKLTARFEEFETIDWIKEKRNEEEREEEIKNTVRYKPMLGRMLMGYEAAQVWIVVFLVGIAIGVNTAMISIATEWLSGMKKGVCSKGWWLNEKFCCWENWNSEGGCEDFREWSEIVFRAKGGIGGGFIEFFMFVLLGTSFGMASGILVKEYAPYAAGSGLPEIKSILAGFFIRGFMEFRTLVIKSVGLALSVASMLSVGKEGPAVHMGCCVGNVICRRFGKYKSNKIKQREILSASAAAGVAVAFGSPIGGVIFSMEDISTVFPLGTVGRSFFCALIATTMLAFMNPFRTGKLVMFHATYSRQWHFFELIFYVLLGVFGGVMGAYLTKFNVKVAEIRKRKRGKILGTEMEVGFLALMSCVLFYFNRFTQVDMGELLGYLFKECSERNGNWSQLCDKGPARQQVMVGLFFATVVRFIGTVFAYGCKVPCGIFVPSMAIGATFGRMVGIAIQMLQKAHPEWALFSQCTPDTPCVTAATYAFLGASAALTGVTRVTVAVVVIMYELTGALGFIVPTMVVVMVSRIVADYLLPSGGITEQLIRLNGIPYLREEEEEEVEGEEEGGGDCARKVQEEADNSQNGDEEQQIILPAKRTFGGKIGDAVGVQVGQDLVVLAQNETTVGQLLELLNNRSCAKYRAFPIVNNMEDYQLEGLVNREDLHNYLRKNSQLIRAEFLDANISFVNNSYSSFNNDIIYADSVASTSIINMWQLVNTTPITVHKDMPVETVYDIFKAIGPRIILVVGDKGKLIGISTFKDILVD